MDTTEWLEPSLRRNKLWSNATHDKKTEVTITDIFIKPTAEFEKVEWLKTRLLTVGEAHVITPVKIYRLLIKEKYDQKDQRLLAHETIIAHSARKLQLLGSDSLKQSWGGSNLKMGLKKYFSDLIQKVEASDEITNAGKDENGFYKPTRTILLRNLNLLRDLYDKPRAKQMVQAAWSAVVKDLPPEWLVLSPADKAELAEIIS